MALNYIIATGLHGSGGKQYRPGVNIQFITNQDGTISISAGSIETIIFVAQLLVTGEENKVYAMSSPEVAGAFDQFIYNPNDANWANVGQMNFDISNYRTASNQDVIDAEKVGLSQYEVDMENKVDVSDFNTSQNEQDQLIDQLQTDKADKDDVDTEIFALQEQVNEKVDKIDGMGLSSNDFTDADKSKLDGLAQETALFWQSVTKLYSSTSTVLFNKSTFPIEVTTLNQVVVNLDLLTRSSDVECVLQSVVSDTGASYDLTSYNLTSKNVHKILLENNSLIFVTADNMVQLPTFASTTNTIELNTTSGANQYFFLKGMVGKVW